MLCSQGEFQVQNVTETWQTKKIWKKITGLLLSKLQNESLEHA